MRSAVKMQFLVPESTSETYSQEHYSAMVSFLTVHFNATKVKQVFQLLKFIFLENKFYCFKYQSINLVSISDGSLLFTLSRMRLNHAFII